MDEEAQAVGARLREIRGVRGKSLAVIAGLAGIHESYLSRLERGERALDRRSLIVALANALQVSPSELFEMGTSPLPTDPVMESSIGGVRDALQAVDMGEPDGQVQPIEELEARAQAVMRATQNLRLADAGAMLPDLIRDLHTTIAAGQDVARLLRLATLLSIKGAQSYLFSVSAPADLSWQAVRAGRDVAQRLDEPATHGVVAFGTANGLIGRGAFDLAARALDATPETGDRELDGVLALSRCLLAAAQLRPGDVEAPLTMAAELAERGGEANRYWMSFGPSNVALWRVSVALEQGEHERAAELSESVELAALAAGRRVTAHIARARAVSQLPKRRDEAVLALRAAERISPDNVHRSPGVRRLLGELVTRTRNEALGRELRGLAYRAGMAV